MTAEIIAVGVVLALGIGAYYSLVLFPKQRDFQKRQNFVNALTPGSEVITAGGIIGTVRDVLPEEGVAFVEIADGLVVRMIAASLLAPFDPDELKRNVQMASTRQEQHQ
jgi:preprotein translocase YajC subunit